MTQTKTLHGIVPPMLTPLSRPDRLDVEGLERLVDHLLAGGVHGLFLLGTTGEGPSLSESIKCELIERVCAQVAGRVPVLVGASDPSFEETRTLSQISADNGAAGVVLAAPFYIPISQAEFVNYLRTAATELPLPIYAYNMPSHVKLSFTADTVRQMLDLPNVVGLKDSSPGAECFHEVREFVRAQRPDFALLIGPEECMAAAIPLGADGGVCGGANVFPRLFVELYEALVAGSSARAALLQAQVFRLPPTIYSLNMTAGYAAIRGMKAALRQMKICQDAVALPLMPLSDAERRGVAAQLPVLASTDPTTARERAAVSR